MGYEVTGALLLYGYKNNSLSYFTSNTHILSVFCPITDLTKSFTDDSIVAFNCFFPLWWI